MRRMQAQPSRPSPDPASGARPRRILSIDGGGIRDLIPIEFLCRLEARLAERTGRADTVLADHFDLVAGTSGGALVASAIVLGKPMQETKAFVLAHAGTMFKPASWRRRLRYWYDKEQLESGIKAFLGPDTTLGSERLRTGVMLVLRNASTDSPWVVSNNPLARFNARELDDCNLKLELWRLARASAAAPVFFAPEEVVLGRDPPKRFVFVDGGLTGFNNPAFKAFLYATTEPYRLSWPAGEALLTVVSVGTGYPRREDPGLRPHRMSLLWNLREVPHALILASDREQDLLCRTFGRCRRGEPIDLEVGDLRQGRTAVAEKLFTYFRINAHLTAEGLAGLGCAGLDPQALARLDAVAHREDFLRIGAALAERHIDAELLDYVAPPEATPPTSLPSPSPSPSPSSRS
ncbi:MAG: hypothetical protein BGO72_06040 [Burkholderiales bacterium 70-64]|nr:MAG: hypothetical protein BGO72_06040 [Burkholderiales bacterium 70-64]